MNARAPFYTANRTALRVFFFVVFLHTMPALLNFQAPHHPEHPLAGTMPVATTPNAAGLPGALMFLILCSLAYFRAEPTGVGDRTGFELNLIYSFTLMSSIALILFQMGGDSLSKTATSVLFVALVIFFLVLLSRALGYSASDRDFTVVRNRRKANIRLGLRNYTFAFALMAAICESLELYAKIEVSSSAKILGILMVAGLISLKLTKWARDPAAFALQQLGGRQ